MKNQKLFLIVKDHSVSNETFSLLHDNNLDLLITAPKPSVKDLPKYYESADYISHSDGKRSILEIIYRRVKNFTIKNKLKLINEWHHKKGALLDIGGGTGEFLSAAQKNDWITTGTEPNDKAREIALKKGVQFIVNTSKLKDNSMDVITMWHVLEHVHDLDAQIIELNRLLKPDGTLFIAVPNFKSFDAKYYGSNWAAFDVPRHLWHFSKNAIQTIFNKQDLTLKKVIPMKFDAFYVALLSEKYKNGTTNYFKAFIIGLKSNWKARKNLEYSSNIYILKKAGN